MNNQIIVENIIKIQQDGTRLFKPISFSGSCGDTIYIQANGHKRTILFKILCGLCPPDNGHILINDNDLYSFPAPKSSILRAQHIGAIPEFTEFIPEISLIDNISLPQLVIGKSKKDAQDTIYSLAQIAGFSFNFNRSPKSLTHLQRAVCSLFKAISTSPEILIFNDFLGVLNDEDSKKVKEILLLIRPANSTLIYMGSSPASPGTHLTQNILL